MPKLKSILPLLLLFTLTLTASIPPSNTNTPYAQVITESKNGTDVHYTYGNDLISNGSSFYLTDALGSTRGLVGTSETLTDSYDYTPYGEIASHVGTSENNFLFTGEQFDKETEYYYLRARYYSPTSSRFLTRDTYDGVAGNPITQNHYLYANANPLMYTDPSGNMSMLGLTAGIAIRGILSATIRSAPILARSSRKMKIWNVYTYTTLWTPHMYMYIGKKNSSIGFRYDVGADDGWGGVLTAKLGSLIPGFIVKNRTINGVTSGGEPLKGIKAKITRFTPIQKLIWEALVLRGSADKCKINYSLAGTNCISWTVRATAQAIAISKLPI